MCEWGVSLAGTMARKNCQKTRTREVRMVRYGEVVEGHMCLTHKRQYSRVWKNLGY